MRLSTVISSNLLILKNFQARHQTCLVAKYICCLHSNYILTKYVPLYLESTFQYRVFHHTIQKVCLFKRSLVLDTLQNFTKNQLSKISYLSVCRIFSGPKHSLLHYKQAAYALVVEGLNWNQNDPSSPSSSLFFFCIQAADDRAQRGSNASIVWFLFTTS